MLLLIWFIENVGFYRFVPKYFFAEARQATTNIQGGLVLTNTIIAGEGTDQSGMTGAQSNNVAFWAGGTLDQAKANTAPVVINRNGNAKFGLLELLGKGASAIMSMFSSDGKERLRLQTNNLTSSSVASQAYYNPSNSQNTNTYDYFDNSPDTTFTTNFTTQQLNEGQETYMLALDKQIIATPPTAHIGTKCYVDRYGASGNNYSYIDITPIQVGSSQPILHYAEVGVTVGETFIKVGTLPQTGQTTTQRILFDDLWNFNITSAVRFQIRYRGYCNVEIEFGYNGNKGGFGYYYYNDVTQARTIIAKNGLGVIVNNLNHLLATYNNSKFLFKYRGDLDVSGCIAAFDLNTAGEKNIIFQASSINIVTGKIQNGRGEFTITGVSSKLIVNITPMGGTGARVSSVTLNGTSCTVVFYTYNGTTATSNNVHIVVFGKLV